MHVSRDAYATVSAAVFCAVSLLQAARAVMGLPIEIGHHLVPVAASWIASVAAAALAVWGWRSRGA